MVRLPVLALLVLALGVTACGGGGGGGTLSKADYEQQVRSLGQQLTADGQKLAGATSAEAFSSAIGTLQDGIRNAADKLASLNPPEDARAATDKLVSALHSLADGFDVVKEAAKKSVMQGFQAAGTVAVSKAARTVQEAVAELKRLGYQIGELGVGTG